MAASAWRMYRSAKVKLGTGNLNLTNSLMRMKLIKAGGAAQVSDYAGITSFASAGSGNAAANMDILSVTGLSFTALAGSNTHTWNGVSCIFTATGGTATSILYAVIGLSGGAAIAWSKLTSTGSINVATGSTLTVNPNANGFFTLAGGET